ncbi:MAG: LPS export ABC transporter periplasmic protein LptC [Ferruginibacter sp.]|nr:LPS export ABC transporter periplasmic protein LptC [Ferruginibacter sp.]
MNSYSTDIKRIAALITGCFFLYSCENDINEIMDFDAKSTGIEIAKKVTVHYSINGKRKAILTSPLMYRVQDTVPYVEFPKTIHVDFFGEKDSIDSKLDARYAKYKETRSIVFLKDSVRVINVLGDTLYCDELYWDLKRTGAEFYTDKPVRIRTRTQIINGIGMEARQDFKEYHIVHPTGIVSVPASQFPN